MKICVILCGVLAGLAGPMTGLCAGDETRIGPNQERSPEPVFVEGITYGIVDAVELKLNLAMPAEAKNGDQRYPLIIFIHGGGWQTGGRNAYNGRIRKTAERGYVAATISHRLTAEKDDHGRPRFPWPVAIHDCKAAVRFLKTHAARFHIDPRRIGVTGASSGGHLALLLGLTNMTDGLEGEIPMPAPANPDVVPVMDTRIHAVFNKSGPAEMVSCHAAPVVTRFVEDLLGRPDQNLHKYHEASPLTYVSAGDPPVMTIHGELDPVVPIEQARMLDKAMTAAGLNHRLIELREEKHVFTRNGRASYWHAFYGFFGEQLKNRPDSP